MSVTTKRRKINRTKSKNIIFEDILESLSQQLKQLCDESGQENEQQLEQSAEIFHKMALHYKQKSPDKLSLIKSAGLLNAAWVRNPRNALQIETYLEDVCCEILKCAKAQIQNVDLIQESNKIAEMIKEMRKYLKSELGPIQRYISQEADNYELFEYQTLKISSIHSLQNKITSDYTKIMSQISKISKKVMGKAPCNFAVIGMGSLARNEITPYSDFEHVIVLENSCKKQNNYFKILEYFRWFSVIFHVIIINLKETILPSLNIEVLESWFYDGFTKRGISFDGMMPHACKFPLGRQKHTDKKPWSTELIKPVDEMLIYLSSEENLKNGYHLGDILTKTCFVHGSKKLSTNFREKVKKLVKTKMDDDAADIILAKEIEKDFDNFSVKSIVSNLRSKKEVNIKKDWYRCTTLFIAALGRIHNIMASSCFEIVYSLYNKGVITDKTKYKLLYVVALACEARLRYYTEKSGQTDVVDLRSQDDDRIPQAFEAILGAQNTISYFQIAYSLQHVVAQRLNLLHDRYFYANPNFLNIFLYCALEFERKMMLLLEKLKQTKRKNSKKLGFDKLIDLLETDMRRTRRSSKPDKWSAIEKAEALKKKGYCLSDQSLFNDARFFFTCSYIIVNEFLVQEKYNFTSANQQFLSKAEKMKGDNLIGQCRCQSRNKKCLETCLEALEIFTRLSKYPERIMMCLKLYTMSGYRTWPRSNTTKHRHICQPQLKLVKKQTR